MTDYFTDVCVIIFRTTVRYDFIEADDTQDGFGIEINWLSILFIALLTGLMLLGTSESTYVQNASVTIYLCLIAFIVFGGASQVRTATENLCFDSYNLVVRRYHQPAGSHVLHRTSAFILEALFINLSHFIQPGGPVQLHSLCSLRC